MQYRKTAGGFLGGLLVVFLSAPSVGGELKTYMGPINVERYSALKAHLGVDNLSVAEAYLKNVEFNYFINMLVDGVLQGVGREFCLPSSQISKSTGQVFWMTALEIEPALKNSEPEANLRNTVASYLATKYPCSKT
jgi:hypothetical protein